jgi:hypothetical protein
MYRCGPAASLATPANIARVLASSVPSRRQGLTGGVAVTPPIGTAPGTVSQIERLQPCTYVRKPFAIDALLAAVLVASTTVRRPH